MDIPRRNIIREQEFEEQLIALLVNEEEADQFTEAAEILLATYPDAGLPASQIASHEAKVRSEGWEIIEAWAGLPEPLRAAILAIVRSARREVSR